MFAQASVSSCPEPSSISARTTKGRSAALSACVPVVAGVVRLIRAVRIHRVEITGYKGIEVAWAWGPLTVLFGPNDVGKTNILEALLELFSGSAWDVRPAFGLEPGEDPSDVISSDVDAEVLFELDGREVPDSPDRDALANTIQFGVASFIDPDSRLDIRRRARSVGG